MLGKIPSAARSCGYTMGWCSALRHPLEYRALSAGPELRSDPRPMKLLQSRFRSRCRPAGPPASCKPSTGNPAASASWQADTTWTRQGAPAWSSARTTGLAPDPDGQDISLYNRLPPGSGYRFAFTRSCPPTRCAVYPEACGFRVQQPAQGLILAEVECRLVSY